MQIPPKNIKTTHLHLYACEHSDAGDLFENYTSLIETAKFLQRKPHDKIEKTINFTKEWGNENWSNSDGKHAWSIKYKDTNRPFGIFIMIIKENAAEIHFGISPQEQNLGVMTETATAITDWIKYETTLESIQTECDREHKACRKVLLKIGLRKQILLRKSLFLPNKSNCLQDSVLYTWHRKV